MKLHPSALKHGLEPEDIIQAAYWSQWIEPLDDDDWPHATAAAAPSFVSSSRTETPTSAPSASGCGD